MAIYALGDIQGCFEPLKRLLDRMKFDPSVDQLWFCGDLVSRGRHSLETLRFVYQLAQSKAALTVLGNHDISLIAAYYGLITPHKTLLTLLDAPDSSELIEWLRRQPLLISNETYKAVLVHAGIPPLWSLALAETCAKQIEYELRQTHPKAWLEQIYGDKPTRWENSLTPIEQQRFTVNALTRMRYCYPNGKLDFEQKLSPKVVKNTYPSLIPWYNHPLRNALDYKILFGHWSTLGYQQVNNTFALDSGCVWGGRLSALRLDTSVPSIIQVSCDDYERH